MAVTGDTQLAATKAELISEIAQRYLVGNSVILPSLRDVSIFARKGAESVSFPKAGGFTVENRATATQATIQNLTYAKDTMLLDERATIAWLIDPMDEIESALDVQNDYIQRATADHAFDIDVNSVAVMEAAGDATVTAGALDQEIFLEMRAKLLRQKARPQNLFFACSPEDEALLLKINPFVSAEQYGSAIIPQGVLGTLYGVKILVTPAVAANSYYMYESDGVAIAFQKAPQFDERKAPEYGSGAMLQILDQKYGLKAVQLGLQGVGPTESALIVKDNN